MTDRRPYADGGLIEGPPDAPLVAKWDWCPMLTAEQARRLVLGSGFLARLNAGPIATAEEIPAP